MDKNRVVYRTIVLPGKFFNNVYLGGPGGPTPKELWFHGHLYVPAETTNEKTTLTLNLIEANYVAGDTENKGLPANPSKTSAVPVDGAYPTRATAKDVTVGSSLLDNLGKFTSSVVSPGKLWSVVDCKGVYLQSITRGNTTLGSSGEYYPLDAEGNKGEPVQDKNDMIDGHMYDWEGWGWMYYKGSAAPPDKPEETDKPDDPTKYPQETMNNVAMDSGPNTYTLVYAKTAMRFTYHKSNVELHAVHLLEVLEAEAAMWFKAREEEILQSLK